MRLGDNVHANGDGDEIVAIENAALADEGVKAEIQKLQLPEGAVVISDPWIYGTLLHTAHLYVQRKTNTLIGADGVDDDNRMYQCFLYLRDTHNPNELDSNHYSLPLPISPVLSTEDMKVIRIDRLPTGPDNTLKDTQPWQYKPANEYIPEAQDLRKDLKPLNVVQPEGASFTIASQGQSNIIDWQKWSFRVGYNQREGMVLYDVRVLK